MLGAICYVTDVVQYIVCQPYDFLMYCVNPVVWLSRPIPTRPISGTDDSPSTDGSPR